jgi:hypothetical protein
MPNTKAVGVAFADPELVDGTTISGAAISGGTITGAAISGGTVTSSTLSNTTKALSNIESGFVVGQQGATVATTGDADVYVIAGSDGVLSSAEFSGVDALAASDTNYITFSITNLGQAGAGTTAMLAATDANTTKTTGGTALAANARRSLTLNATPANLIVVVGDRLRIRAAATGTLANTVTFPVYSLKFAVS